MNFGLSETQQQYLESNLIELILQSGGRVWVFGSRAKDTHHPFSDVDIVYAFDGKNFDLELQREIARRVQMIKDSNFPFKIDMVHLPDLSPHYLPHVLADRVAWPMGNHKE